MRYAKLNGGELTAAPNPLRLAGVKTYNPPDDLLLAAGYLPVVETPYPEEEGHYIAHWEEQERKIVRVWESVPEPEPEPAPEPVPVPELTPAQKRELSYDSAQVIAWGGDMLTVTQAAQQWAYYAAEGDEDKTRTLTALIAQAKDKIRELYPDGASEGV